jgi:transmembrane sensor
MNTAQRIVALEEGEAWFRVAKDASRPFIVEAGRVRVRALGTAFSVRRQESGANVLVSEGIVETWVAGAEGHTVRVGAGAKAFVAENAAISTETPAEAGIDRALAWRAGKIDLAGETLADAVEEFNRYNRRKLIIADARLAQERLYGVFRTDDPQGFAYAVKRSLGTEVSLADGDEIRLGE